jgi:hypothetical protein
MGEKSDITLTSKSALTLHFDKAVSVGGEKTYSLTFTGKVSLESGDAISITAGTGKKIFIGNSAMDIYTMLSALIDEIKGLKTFGQPGMHTVDPSSIVALTEFKTTKLDPLFTA